MQTTRTRELSEYPVLKGFSGREFVKSGVIRAAGLKAQNAVQLISIQGSPEGGTFTITVGADTTSALAYNASAATVQTAIRALTAVGAGNADVTGPAGGPYRVEYISGKAGTAMPVATGNASLLTGGSNPKAVHVQEVRPGKAASALDAYGRAVLYEGTILTVDPSNPTSMIEFTAQGGEAIVGILSRRLEFFGTTSPQYDLTAGVYTHNCVFDKNLIKNYATHASALATALPTCKFD